MSHRILKIAVATLAVGLTAILASGCGDSDSNGKAEQAASTERQASAEAFPDSKTCPEKNPSFSFSFRVVNLLPWAMKLKAGDYTCDDWSGVSTPGRALNDQVVPSRKRMTFRLEPRQYRTRKWTMEFGTEGGGTYGQVDLSIPLSIDPDPGGNVVQLLGPNLSKREKFPREAPVTDCDFAYVNSINTKAAPQTPDSDYRVPDPDSGGLGAWTIALVSRNGQFAVAQCS